MDRAIDPILFGMLGAAILLLLKMWIIPTRPNVATIDLTGIIHQYTQAIAQKTNSRSSMKSHMRAFSQHLSRTLQFVATEHHVVLMPRQAVVSGAADYTDEVVRRLTQQMHQAAQVKPQHTTHYFGEL